MSLFCLRMRLLRCRFEIDIERREMSRDVSPMKAVKVRLNKREMSRTERMALRMFTAFGDGINAQAQANIHIQALVAYLGILEAASLDLGQTTAWQINQNIGDAYYPVLWLTSFDEVG